MAPRSWRFVPVVGLVVLIVLLIRGDRLRLGSPPAGGQERGVRAVPADHADLAVAFMVTMASLVGIILVMLAAALLMVPH
jgi:hypothetical protein